MENKKIKGLIEGGNIDLNNRKVLDNNDGSISTESSITVTEDGYAVNIPTVINGKRLEGTPQEQQRKAIDHYRQTGRHLGKFDSIDNAVKDAVGVHVRQEKKYVKPKAKKPTGVRQYNGNNATTKKTSKNSWK